MSKLQVRLISPWTTRIETEDAVFCTQIPTDRADALLCEWAPSPELFAFPRRKAWYCCEPKCQFDYLGGGQWKDIRARLAPEEFLNHGHRDARFRVPHITHVGDIEMNCNRDRKQRAIAIVSNHGGPPWKCHPDIRYRNQLITDPVVDLYGRSGWKKYRPHWFSWPKAPKNYRGEIPGDWPSDQKRILLSQHKVCVCLENMNEPGYFTEKFVESIIAGCIPVYRASSDVRDSVLKDAFWIDPSDVRYPGRKAIQAALDSDLEHVQHVNSRWLTTSPELAATEAHRVFDRIGRILVASL